jgi:hypothetical protein
MVIAWRRAVTSAYCGHQPIDERQIVQIRIVRLDGAARERAVAIVVSAPLGTQRCLEIGA